MSGKVRERTHREALASDLGTLTHDAEGLLAQRDQAVAALAATLAAVRTGEANPEVYALPVLTRYGLAPAGTTPAHAFAQAALADSGRGLRRAVTLPVSTHAPEFGRWLISSLGAEWQLQGPVLDDARSVLTELVSNAIRHADWSRVPARARRIEVVLSLAAGTLRIEVGDPDPTLPTEGVLPEITDIEDLASAAGLGGFGLVSVVGALATQHGAHRVDGGGKVCWADLDARPIGAGR